MTLPTLNPVVLTPESCIDPERAEYLCAAIDALRRLMVDQNGTLADDDRAEMQLGIDEVAKGIMLAKGVPMGPETNLLEVRSRARFWAKEVPDMIAEFTK